MQNQEREQVKPQDVSFADSAKIFDRKTALERFVDKMFEPDLRPWFVSDEATIFDISGDSTEEIVKQIKVHYGVLLTQDQLRMPVWKLLDLLEPIAQK
jgi:hypothetical protein